MKFWSGEERMIFEYVRKGGQLYSIGGHQNRALLEAGGLGSGGSFPFFGRGGKGLREQSALFPMATAVHGASNSPRAPGNSLSLPSPSSCHRASF